MHMGHILWDSGDFGGVHGPSSMGFRGLRGWHGPSSVGHGGFRAVILETGNQRRAKTSILQVLGICFGLDDISFGKIKEMKRNT